MSESDEETVRRLAKLGPLMSGNRDIRGLVLGVFGQYALSQSRQYNEITRLRAENAALVEVERAARPMAHEHSESCYRVSRCGCRELVCLAAPAGATLAAALARLDAVRSKR